MNAVLNLFLTYYINQFHITLAMVSATETEMERMFKYFWLLIQFNLRK